MDFLPLFHKLSCRPCLLVGGGDIALRKAKLLLKAEAKITVLAPSISESLKALVEPAGGTLIYAHYDEKYLKNSVLVISATDDETVNEQVSSDCHKRQLPVNVVDNPKLCSVIMPAIVDRSPLIIGVTSGGEAPVLARLVRAKLESLFPASYGQLAQLASKFRQKVKLTVKDGEIRRRFWESVLSGSVAELVFSGQHDQAEKQLLEQLGTQDQTVNGEVYLVGAGPGDPDLLTFKALRLMQQAEVVLYDRLVSEPILEMARRDAEFIYVGKRRSHHAVPQKSINELLVEHALEGKRVLRLKGGDPFIFGRGGEEISLLAQNGIPFQVVPGITAASGCAAYAGIPLTHRDYAQSVRFITGHLKDGLLNLSEQDLVHENQTLVFYMSLVALEQICLQLIQIGRQANTPCALVEHGTTARQRVHVSDLGHIVDMIAQRNVKAPTLFIIGQVVTLRKDLAWFTGVDTE